ncbi:MAG: hypothetical protein KAR40_05970 [Candidatus Sabulitectum sp.]|nr:hypothetical protein [Candidatus Sabulitectum sp.]
MTDKKDIAKREPSAVAIPTEMPDFGEMKGAGFENQTQADVAIPFLGMLQQLSPQLKKKNEASYIEGAEAGDLINSVTNELIPRPATIVPCTTDHLFVEWVPRESGGGFVDIHTLDSEVVKEAKAKSQGFNDLKTVDGNDLVETFYIYALLLDSPDATEATTPIVIGFTSTKIKVYKRIMTALRTLKGEPPIFAFRLSINTVEEVNSAKQEYQNFTLNFVHGSAMTSINTPGSKFDGLLKAGMAFKEAVTTGDKKADHASQGASSTAGAKSEDENAPF